jgi:hypothetical protein
MELSHLSLHIHHLSASPMWIDEFDGTNETLTSQNSNIKALFPVNSAGTKSITDT